MYTGLSTILVGFCRHVKSSEAYRIHLLFIFVISYICEGIVSYHIRHRRHVMDMDMDIIILISKHAALPYCAAICINNDNRHKISISELRL